MRRLSRPLAEIQPKFDAIVVGSGYGGGVAASRLFRMAGVEAEEDRGDLEGLQRDLLEYLDGRRTRLDWPLDFRGAATGAAPLAGQWKRAAWASKRSCTLRSVC